MDFEADGMTIDGEDVLRRCLSIDMEGEVPVSVRLALVNEHGQFFVRGDAVADEVRTGAIVVENLRSRRRVVFS